MEMSGNIIFPMEFPYMQNRKFHFLSRKHSFDADYSTLGNNFYVASMRNANTMSINVTSEFIVVFFTPPGWRRSRQPGGS